MADPDDEDGEGEGLAISPAAHALETPDGFEERFLRLLSDMGCADVGGGRSFTLAATKSTLARGSVTGPSCSTARSAGEIEHRPNNFGRRFSSGAVSPDPIIEGAQTSAQYGEYKEVSLVVAAYGTSARQIAPMVWAKRPSFTY